MDAESLVVNLAQLQAPKVKLAAHDVIPATMFPCRSSAIILLFTAEVFIATAWCLKLYMQYAIDRNSGPTKAGQASWKLLGDHASMDDYPHLLGEVYVFRTVFWRRCRDTSLAACYQNSPDPVPSQNHLKTSNPGPRHQHGYATASYDLLYGDPMDFLSSKGYSCLGSGL